MPTSLITLKPYQITPLKELNPSFDEEEVQFRGRVLKKDLSFDHEFGTKAEYDYYVEELELKLGDSWYSVIQNGEYGDEIYPLERDQIEGVIEKLK